MFDEIFANYKCPYCGNSQYESVQTKILLQEFNEYKVGSLLEGGPFINGEYPLYNHIVCKKCSKEFGNSFYIKNNQIVSIQSYSMIEYNNKNWSVLTPVPKLLFLNIRKVAVTAILCSKSLSNDYDYDCHFSRSSNYKELLSIISKYIRMVNGINTEDFVMSVLNDIDLIVDIPYLEEVHIDFSKYYKTGGDRQYNYKYALDDYDDIITHLRMIVKSNIPVLKDQLIDYCIHNSL